VKALDYSRYDINRYHFWTLTLEASRQLAATVNNKVVANGEEASGLKPTIVAYFKNFLSTHLVVPKS
jgi:hypothetical protein